MMKGRIVNIVYELTGLPDFDLDKAFYALKAVVDVKYDPEQPFKRIIFYCNGFCFDVWASGKVYGKGLKSWKDIWLFKATWKKLFKKHLISCTIKCKDLNNPPNFKPKIRF